ncbi:MAG: PmoA family protein [Sedimentisphaerales bacterium]|nr:PmoA family protein [Sedimentisphaerales bacterium]
MNRPSSVVVGLVIVFAFAGVIFGEGTLATVRVDAGAYDRVDTPVGVSLEGVALWPGEGSFMLVEKASGETASYPAQLEAGSEPRLWFVLAGTTKAGTKRTFSLVRTAKAKLVGVTAVETDKYLDIVHQGDKVLRYNSAIVPPPEGQDKLYERSGFIHPLWSTKGTVLTNIHPKDHIHHIGIWMPWTHTEFEGKATDFWNLKEGQGTVRFVRYISTTEGPVYGGFEAEQEHVALKNLEDHGQDARATGQKVVLNEVWNVRVYNVGGPAKGYRIVDFVSTQRCVASSPLKQVEYRYGGFGYRATGKWDEANAEYLTSEGKNRKNGHATRARWCDTSGEIDGWEGITFYSHPENFGHPEPMRIWPEGQVFFNWAPGQLGDWEMKPGEDHVFRYRMYVHEGKITVPAAERIWQDYAEPPKVTIDAAQPKAAIMLFDGKDLSTHWTAGNKDIGWEVADGVATITPKSGSIWTKENFGDFMMHLEFCTPQTPASAKGQARGNSGVYIQRRYELQILDSSRWELTRQNRELGNNDCASLYKTKAPDVNVCRLPGQWQSYDITFHAAKFDGKEKTEDAKIKVWHNGVPVHNDVKIPDKTGAGQAEGPEPGPILLQEHGNAVKFRNIWIVPL